MREQILRIGERFLSDGTYVALDVSLDCISIVASGVQIVGTIRLGILSYKFLKTFKKFLEQQVTHLNNRNKMNEKQKKI